MADSDFLPFFAAFSDRRADQTTNLANAAEVARFEINYRSELHWLTYFSVMQFYKHVRDNIAEPDPVDNIEVQNFIWCTRSGPASALMTNVNE